MHGAGEIEPRSQRRVLGFARALAAPAILLAASLGLPACSEGTEDERTSLPDVGARAPARSASLIPGQAWAAGGAGQVGDRALGVSALGRLEPEDGLIRVAGPSASSSVVIEKLLVDEGDHVKAGQVIATLDTVDVLTARVKRLKAELENAGREHERTKRLSRGDVVSDSEADDWETRERVASAALEEARSELKRAHVKSPFDGQVIEVHAREGERVGPEGIIELGRTEHMFAIAEVYETDVTRVRIGQPATITSPALPRPLTGKVDWINLKVGKQDSLGTDPAARKDARVVEVEIRLDESELVGGLTNLQVEIQIGP